MFRQRSYYVGVGGLIEGDGVVGGAHDRSCQQISSRVKCPWTLYNLWEAGCVGEGKRVGIYVPSGISRSIARIWSTMGPHEFIISPISGSSNYASISVEGGRLKCQQCLRSWDSDWLFPALYWCFYVFSSFSTMNTRTIYNQFFKCVTFAIYIWCKLYVLQSHGIQIKISHKKHTL